MAWAKLELDGQDSKKLTNCKRCGAEIVWLKSKKGKSYPVDFNGLTDVLTADFHKCGFKAKSLGGEKIV